MELRERIFYFVYGNKSTGVHEPPLCVHFLFTNTIMSTFIVHETEYCVQIRAQKKVRAHTRTY